MSGSAKTERRSGIELLRVIAAVMVVILHFNNSLYGAALDISDGAKHELLMLLECCSIPAVNIFVMISGLFLCDRHSSRIKSIIRLFIKAVVIQMILYMISSYRNGFFNCGDLLKRFIVNNYFVTLYITLMFLSQYINILLDRLTIHDLRKLIAVCMILFSVWITLLDWIKTSKGIDYTGLYTVGTNGSGRGYTFVNFLLCYMVGAWIHKDRELIKRIPQSAVISVWAVVSIVLTIMYHYPDNVALEYCNPFVILSSVLLVVFFERLPMNNRVINKLATASFTCFMINIPIINKINVHGMVSGPLFKMVMYLIGLAAFIYFVSWIFECIYGLAEKGVCRLLLMKNTD